MQLSNGRCIERIAPADLVALEAKLPSASLQLAKELFGILGTVDSSAGLRRALTDPSRSGDEKSALIKQLFGGKVSAGRCEIASGLASSRWASARDIGDALETLAASVVIAVAENKSAVSASVSAGWKRWRMICSPSTRLSIPTTRYSVLCPSRRRARPQRLSSPPKSWYPVPARKRRSLSDSSFAAPRLKVTKLIRRFAELAAKRQQRWIATVSVTRPLTETQTSRLQAGLNALYGRELKINMNVDPELIVASGSRLVTKW